MPCGTFVKLTDPAVPELLALAGFDFFVLDTEHVAVDREQLSNHRPGSGRGRHHAIVRVRENQQVEIRRIWTWDMRACRCPM